MSRFTVAPIALVWAAMLAIAPAHAAVNDDARKDAADKIEGRRLYHAECASCHGPIGAGDGPARGTAKVPDFTTPQAVVAYDFDKMLAGIEAKHDKALTGQWAAKLADGGARNVVLYMREAFMLPAPTADATRGRAIFARTCSVCHGERGNGSSWAKNSLNPSPFDFTSDKAKELSRRHMINTVTYGSPKTAMMGFSTQLSREDIAAVVDYIRETFVYPQGNPDSEKATGGALSYGNRMLNSQGGHHGGGGGDKHASHGMSGPINMDDPMPNGLAGDAAAGKRFFDSNCFTCHGKEGKGDGPRAYFINPKPANFTAPEARTSLNRPHLFKSISMGSNGSEMPAWSKVLTDQEIANIAEYVFTAFIQPGGVPAQAEPAKASASPADGAQKKIGTDTLELGRQVYNFRCYFCHGYSGDGKTVAAQMLDPKPKDFTQAHDLTLPTILRRLREGKPGTAMKSFSGVLSEREMEAVAAFVMDEFVTRKAPNTAYHTAANGWPDHQSKYGAAYPFVRGELSLDTPPSELDAGQRAGRDLYLDACITCHEPRTAGKAWEAYPLSHMGEIIRDPVDLISRPSVYGLHDRPFDVAGLNDSEKAGKAIYDENCAFCHARDGTGKNWIGSFLEPHPRDFTDSGQTRHLTRERLLKVMREGLENTSMPAWGSVLTPEQMSDVAAYLEKAFLTPARSGADGPQR